MAKITKIVRNGTEYTVGSGDVAYSDFNWVTKTWATVTLDLASKITPTVNFTVNAPANISDGQTYVLRVDNSELTTAYTMTLWTNMTNPYGVSLDLTAWGIDQFVFLAIGWNLELQPELGGEWWIINDTTGSSASVTKIWAWTQAEYEALSVKSNDTLYFTTES